MAKSSVIGRLVVAIGANSAQLNTELAKSRRRTKSWSRQLRTHTNVAAKSFVGVGAVGAAAMAQIYNATAPAIDAHAKFARQIGATSEGLAGLQHAANQTAGMTDGQLNKSLQRMTRRISEAADGTGEARAVIAELGLDARALEQMRPEAAFAHISDAMQDVDGQSDRLRMAFKLFDSEGASLANTLAVGSEGLREYQAEAEELGIAVSSFDAAKVEYANDQLDLMGKRAEGVRNQITVGMTPAIVAFTEQVGSLGGSTIDWAAITQKAGRIVIQVLGVAANAWRGVEAVVDLVFLGVEKLGQLTLIAVRNVIESVGNMRIAFAELRDQISIILNGVIDDVGNVHEKLAGFVDSISFGRVQLPPIDMTQFHLSADSAEQVRDSVKETLAGMDDLITASNYRVDAADEALRNTLMQELPSAAMLDRYEAAIERLEQLRNVSRESDTKDSEEDGEAVLTDEQIESAAASMRQITDYMVNMLSTRERMQQAHQERLQAIDEARAAGLIETDSEANAMRDALHQDFAKRVDEHNQEIEERTRKRAEQQAAIERELTEQIKAEQRERLQGIAKGLEITADYFSGLAELNSALTQDYSSQTQKRLEHLNAQLETGLISKEVYEQRSAKIKQAGAEQQDRVNKRLHEQNKWLQYGQTLASGLAAGIRAYSELGPVAGAWAAGAIALKTTAALAKIKKSQYKSTAGDVGSYGDVTSSSSAVGQSASSSPASQSSQAKQPINLYFGNVTGFDKDQLYDEWSARLTDDVESGDVVMINPESYNGRLLRGA